MYQSLSRILIFLLALSLNATTSNGQDAIFSQFFSTPAYLNPAFTGTDAGFRTVLNYRNHPLPDAGNFSTMNAAVDVYVPALYGGVGLNVTSDYQGGLSWNNHIDVMYAYHLKLSSSWYMNMAAQAGYYRQDINWGNLEFTDPSQPPPAQDYKHSPNFAAGMIIYNDWLYGGIASHHLAEPEISFFGNDVLKRKYTAHLGMMIEPASQRRANTLLVDYFISPNIIFQNQEPFTRINYGLYFGIESFMAGFWYRQSIDNPSSLIFLVGLSLGDYRIGYSYDYSLSGYADALHGIHEVSLSFSFLTSEQKRRTRTVWCPHF